MRRLGGLAAAALVLAAPLAARAGDGGTAPPTLHVSVTRVKVTGKADAAARKAVAPEQVAVALCAGLQTRAGVACLTPSDAENLARLRGLQGLVGGCTGGPCAQADSALNTLDDLVRAAVEVKGSGYVLHLVVYHPPVVDPVFRADVEVASAAALLAAARATAVKAAPHLQGP